jgi:type IV pilus assembly protein PilA
MSLLNLLEEFIMFEKIRKMKNKKGFTLVELIVVLVILAILAALLIPALTGYIDKANKEKVVATTRMVVMAAQTEASEKYGLKAAGQLNNGNNITVSYDGTTASNAVDGIDIKAIGKLAEVMDDADAFVNGVTSISVTINAKGTVTDATVVQSGFTCTYDADGTDKYSVAD